MKLFLTPVPDLQPRQLFELYLACPYYEYTDLFGPYSSHRNIEVRFSHYSWYKLFVPHQALMKGWPEDSGRNNLHYSLPLETELASETADFFKKGFVTQPPLDQIEVTLLSKSDGDQEVAKATKLVIDRIPDGIRISDIYAGVNEWVQQQSSAELGCPDIVGIKVDFRIVEPEWSTAE